MIISYGHLDISSLELIIIEDQLAVINDNATSSMKIDGDIK